MLLSSDGDRSKDAEQLLETHARKKATDKTDTATCLWI